MAKPEHYTGLDILAADKVTRDQTDNQDWSAHLKQEEQVSTESNRKHANDREVN